MQAAGTAERSAEDEAERRVQEYADVVLELLKKSSWHFIGIVRHWSWDLELPITAELPATRRRRLAFAASPAAQGLDEVEIAKSRELSECASLQRAIVAHLEQHGDKAHRHLWEGRVQVIDTQRSGSDAECEACGKGWGEWLHGEWSDPPWFRP
jgi:hypothetical protein